MIGGLGSAFMQRYIKDRILTTSRHSEGDRLPKPSESRAQHAFPSLLLAAAEANLQNGVRADALSHV
jgi:hypothetical protein